MEEKAKFIFERSVVDPDNPNANGPFVLLTLVDENGEMIRVSFGADEWKHNISPLLVEVARGAPPSRQTWTFFESATVDRWVEKK